MSNEDEGSMVDQNDLKPKKTEKPQDPQETLFDILNGMKNGINVMSHNTVIIADILKKYFEEKDTVKQETVKACPPSTSTKITPSAAPVASVTSPVNEYIRKTKNLFEPTLETLLTFTEEGNYIVIKPIQFLGSENFAKIAQILRDNDGEYVSAGRGSHFRILKLAIK